MSTQYRPRRPKSFAWAVLVVTVLIAGSLFGFRPTLAAQGGQVFDVAASMQSNLQRFRGERVEVRLTAGDGLEGTVEDVGTEVVHLSRLSGKDFYDALVRIDQIGALVVRARGN